MLTVLLLTLFLLSCISLSRTIERLDED